MHQLLLFVSLWLSISVGICQTAPTFPDLPTITKMSVGKAKVGMPVAQLKQLYQGATFTPTYLAQYGFDDFGGKPSGTLVRFGKQKLFVYFTDWQMRKKVGGILALHPAYKTISGIHVGSTSGELKVVFATVRVVPNVMLLDIQIAFTGQSDKPDIEYIFFKQKAVGRYVMVDEPTRIVATDAKISWIQVYPRQ